MANINEYTKEKLNYLIAKLAESGADMKLLTQLKKEINHE